MSKEHTYHQITQAIHSGYEPDGTTSRGIPLYRTAAYQFNNAEHAANLFALKELGNIYTRITNPTLSALEARVAAIEGGAAAVAFSSGTAAIQNTILNIARTGDEIISANTIYGGTYTMFDRILPEFGITTQFVNPFNLDNFKQAINEKTKAIFIETIGNPALPVLDIEEIAKIAHDNSLPLIIDATFTTPFLIKAIDFGADIVINSLTKWYSGHGNAIGGVVVDSGKFNWKDNPRFPKYNEPDTSYHGIRWAHDLGPLSPVAFAIRLRVIPLRNLGACLSPDNAWLFLQGIETLSLRIKQHCQNAKQVAEFLSNHPKINKVNYPGILTDPSHELALRYFNTKEYGFGGMVVADIKGGLEAGKKFQSNLKLFSLQANVGDTRSLVIHPASTTHSQLNEEQQSAAGIGAGQIRLSVGIEHIDDILYDLEQALETI